MITGTHGTVTRTSLIGKERDKIEMSFMSFEVIPPTAAILPSSSLEPL